MYKWLLQKMALELLFLTLGTIVFLAVSKIRDELPLTKKIEKSWSSDTDVASEAYIH